MRDELIYRLRAYAETHEDSYPDGKGSPMTAEILKQAADEIERLSAENKVLTIERDGWKRLSED